MKYRDVFLLVFLILGTSALAAQATYDRAADQHDHHVFMQNSGWCWFQDPRALVHRKMLYIGGVQGTSPGSATVGIFNLRRQRIEGLVTMNEHFDHDDHNSPVFYARPDGSVLSMYALHGRDRKHLYRISDTKNPLHWSREYTYEHAYPKAGNVTYMNLYHLQDQGVLYNFFRGINYNPSFITSKDHGETWSNPTHLIEDEVDGRHRPYARYCSDGKSTIHISFTDAHPRNYGNSLYYAVLKDNHYHRVDGSTIKAVADGPLLPSEADLVYVGRGGTNEETDLSVPYSAWTSSISHDEEGHPHIAYSVYLDNQDHRYRIASWDGIQWQDREVAHAGGCLYDRESSYTGLIALDPQDPSYVVISTDVHPTTGAPLGVHEIFSARVGPGMEKSNIKWVALTEESPVRNIRPLILRYRKKRVVVWMRGDFRTYTDYDLDAVGLIERIR
ncbi:MAG: BNR repeat-containing protein [Saprospiraceae bacterium]|nr:BNR repeat-containing protein [Saprospiraceae bacterium]